MSLEANKQALLAFAAAYTRGDWDAVEALLTEDFRWVVPTARAPQSDSLRQQGRTMTAADRSRDETLAVFKSTQGTCVDGKFSVEVLSMTAEGDRVAAEARSYAVSSTTGRVYNNQYVYVMHFRGGKISLFREYQDTLHAFDVWLAA